MTNFVLSLRDGRVLHKAWVAALLGALFGVRMTAKRSHFNVGYIRHWSLKEYDKKIFHLILCLHKQALHYHKLVRAPEQRDMFRPYKVSSDVHTCE